MSSLARIAAVIVLWSATPSEAADKITLEAVTMRLAYEGTGTLSDNIAPPAQFSGFNTVIGEGSAAEPANDILVTAVLAAPGETNGEEKLVIVARRTSDRKVLAGRIIEHPFVGKAGKSYRSILIQDATCDGVEVTVTYGKQRKIAAVPFKCGE